MTAAERHQLVKEIADEVQTRGRKHCSGESLTFDRHNLERAIEAALVRAGGEPQPDLKQLWNSWQARIAEHEADHEDGRAAEVRQCANELNALAVRAGGIETPLAEPEIEALIDRAGEWQAQMFDREVAGCTPDGKDWTPTDFEVMARQIISDLMLALAHSTTAEQVRGAVETLVRNRVDIWRKKARAYGVRLWDDCADDLEMDLAALARPGGEETPPKTQQEIIDRFKFYAERMSKEQIESALGPAPCAGEQRIVKQTCHDCGGHLVYDERDQAGMCAHCLKVENDKIEAPLERK